ncbi:Gfo/Idh/MocA family oxidoreductase [Galbitalea sp. SE-J8]|uniref:Gfo/Idh/MocA family protein n=1 Tax=Galbitalea sp. SE-J8 TaxID=3054952 RepID=UPI00259D185C|nr:Gfo/Idh/MocA family oxidoreductase [Galbitalea sp. SE-J8]MDM4761843.1 Gfo/Idh/MocA family oxidoreductase [Galbitalea sp. SE-J8]
MPTTTAIRVGLIGYGLAGRVFHAPFIAANPDLELALVSTSDPARAAEAAERYPSARVVARAEDVLASDVDLVVVASPVHAHFEQVSTALAAGHAVVVDKPFVPSVAEAKQLIAVAEEAERALIVFHNRRWDGDFLTVKALVEQGRIGAVHRFESTFERWGGALRERWQDEIGPEVGGGIAFDLGSHLVDQALQLFGPAEVELAEFARVREGATSEDDAFIALRHRNGVRSHLTLSRVAALSGPRFRVLGSDGAYAVHGLDPQEGRLRSGTTDLDGIGVATTDAWGELAIGGDVERVPTLDGDYAAFYRGVVATIRDGEPAPVDPRDALEVVRILENAHAVARANAAATA